LPPSKSELAPVERGELAPLEADVARARHFAEQATAPNTRRAYAADWRAFASWCQARAVEAERAAPALVAVYLASMADAGAPAPTIERAYAGVASALREHHPEEWPLGRRPPACGQVLRGIRRVASHRVTPKRAAVLAELDELLAACSDGIAGLRDRAVLLVGFAGAMRRSELVGLDVGDCAFVDEGLRVIVGRSKTDPTGKGLEKGIARGRKAYRCPVRALRAWLDAAGILEGPVFRRVTKGGKVLPKRLGDRSVALIVKRAAQGAGLPWAQFAGHSLRAGFVTEAARQRKPLDAMMRQTGHRSVASLLLYIRHATIFEENASEGLL
jgi:integrase